jgi:hypothetical protein
VGPSVEARQEASLLDTTSEMPCRGGSGTLMPTTSGVRRRRLISAAAISATTTTAPFRVAWPR